MQSSVCLPCRTERDLGYWHMAWMTILVKYSISSLEFVDLRCKATKEHDKWDVINLLLRQTLAIPVRCVGGAILSWTCGVRKHSGLLWNALSAASWRDFVVQASAIEQTMTSRTSHSSMNWINIKMFLDGNLKVFTHFENKILSAEIVRHVTENVRGMTGSGSRWRVFPSDWTRRWLCGIAFASHYLLILIFGNKNRYQLSISNVGVQQNEARQMIHWQSNRKSRLTHNCLMAASH